MKEVFVILLFALVWWQLLKPLSLDEPKGCVGLKGFEGHKGDVGPVGHRGDKGPKGVQIDPEVLWTLRVLAHGIQAGDHNPFGWTIGTFPKSAPRVPKNEFKRQVELLTGQCKDMYLHVLSRLCSRNDPWVERLHLNCFG